MVDLTPKELEANLWCVHVVAAGYGHDPPDGSVLAGSETQAARTPLAILIERCDQAYATVGRRHSSAEWEYVIWWVEAHADTSVP